MIPSKSPSENAEDDDSTTNEIQDTLRSLLSIHDGNTLENDDSDTSTRLCLQLISQLESVQQKSASESTSSQPESRSNDNDLSPKVSFIRTNIADYHNASAAAISVRDVLGSSLSSDTLSKLPLVLSEMMATRVELEDLLPATQDEAANLEALHAESSITLTRTSFVAAKLYATLLGMPGAWGAGILDVGAISGMAALLRRWNVECMGAASTNSSSTNNADDQASSKRKRSTLSSPANNKKKSKTRTTVVAELSDDEEDEDELSQAEQAQEWKDALEDTDSSNGAILSPRDLILQGLQVCLALGSALLQKDFMSWSEEAREAMVEAAVVALLTSSAMTQSTARVRKGARRTLFQDEQIASLGQQVTTTLSEAIQRCLVVTSSLEESEVDQDDINDTTTSTNKTMERHETAVFILRGLLPSLSLQTDLPNGQDGRDSAHRVALSTLVGLVDAVGRDLTTAELRMTPSTRTPKNAKRSSMASTASSAVSSEAASTPAPTTGRKGRKKRVSFGGLEGGDIPDSDKQAPPTLKGSSTPRRSQLTPSCTHGHNGKPRPVLSAVVGMMQKLATSKAVEKASIRDGIVDVLQEVLPVLPILERACFLRFVLHLCHSKVSHHRLTASEILGRILAVDWLWKDHSKGGIPLLAGSMSASKSSRASFSPIVESSSENMALALFRALLGRLLDKSSVVRARAAICIAETVRTVSATADGMDSTARVSFEEALESVFVELISTLRKRATKDEKATVRKNSVGALAEVLTFGDPDRIDEVDINVLCHMCTDPSVAARKAAADALTSLLQHSYKGDNKRAMVSLENAWTSSVLPLVMDAEPTCVDKAVDLFATVVVGPLVDATREKGKAAEEQRSSQQYMSSWRMLGHVHEASNKEGATRGQFGALKDMLQRLEASYHADIFKDLLSETQAMVSKLFVSDQSSSPFLEDTTKMQAVGIWCLLDAATDQEKPLAGVTAWTKRQSTKLEFLVTSWENLLNAFLACDGDNNNADVSLLILCLGACIRVLSSVVMNLPVTDVESLSSSLKSLLGTFVFPSTIAGAAVTALVTFTKRTLADSTPDAIKRECSEWIGGLSQLCEQEIASFVSHRSTSDCTEVTRALFLAGELCMVGFRADEDSPSRASILRNGSLGPDDVLAGLYARPSSSMMRLVQSVLPKHLPHADSSSDTELIENPDSVRAHAFVTLGKLCLRDENLAKDCLNILARELHQNMTDKCVSVQSNALLVLGDLCVKYTNLVDRYLPVMAACLQSGSTDTETYELFDAKCEGTALVRKHAVLLLSSLLLQDYIKWRGLLFHRFLVASADNDDGVARLSEMALTGPLLSKHPKLFFNNFVESIFVLNRCTAHPIYASAASAGDNGAGISVGFDGISLTGPLGRAKRHHMYQMMLLHMSDEEKIGIMARISKDVLGAALDSQGDLGRVCRAPPGSRVSPARGSNDANEDNAFNVLSDAFAILTSSALRVGRRATEADDAVNDSTTDAGKAMHVAVAKGKLLSKISRKHLIEIVLPILCKLKVLLHASCNPLLKDLMAFMVEIFRVYKMEVKEFLANDPTLLQEIEYDARQFKKNNKFVTPSPGASSLEPMPNTLITLGS